MICIHTKAISIDISQFFQHCMSKLTDLEFQSLRVSCEMLDAQDSAVDQGWIARKPGCNQFSLQHLPNWRNIDFCTWHLRKHSIPYSRPAWQWNILCNASQNIVHVRHLGLPEWREKNKQNDHLPPQLLLKCLEPPHFHQAFYRLLPFSPGKSQQNSPLEPGLRRLESGCFGSPPPPKPWIGKESTGWFSKKKCCK